MHRFHSLPERREGFFDFRNDCSLNRVTFFVKIKDITASTNSISIYRREKGKILILSELIEKNDKKFHFSHFCLKNEADQLTSLANFLIFYIKNFKSGFSRGWKKLQLQKSPKESSVSLLIWNRH